MESINENSDEFYRKKYLKYKQKYIETKQLYGEELEGGKWGDITFVFCTEKIHNMMRRLYDGTNTNIKKFLNKDVFFFLLGSDSYYTVYGTKDIQKCWPIKINYGENFWVNNENESALGFRKKTQKEKGFFSKEEKEVTVTEESMTIAKEQINAKIGQSDNILNGLKYFYFKSKPIGWITFFGIPSISPASVVSSKNNTLDDTK